MFWQWARKVGDAARGLALVPAVYLGFACTRRWSSWLASFSLNGFVGTDAFGTVVLVANPAALLACVLLIGATGSLLRHGWLVVGSAVAMAAGSACALFPFPEPVAFVGSAVALAGFGAMFLMWLEAYGRLETREMVVAYFGSLVVYAALQALMLGYSPALAPFLVAALPLVGGACLVAAVLRGERRRPAAARSAAGAGEAARGPGAGLAKPHMDRQAGRVVVWIAVFGLVFGMGDSVVGADANGAASTAGRAALALAMVLVALFAARRLTLCILYRLSLPLMAAGLAAAFFFAADPRVSRLLLSAGMEGYQGLAFMVCCGAARRDGSSPAWLCGIVFAAEALAIQAGKSAMGAALAAAGPGLLPAAGALAVIALIVAALWLFTEGDLVSSYSEQALRSVREGRRLAGGLEEFAASRGLTDKEKDVFFLMAGGKATQQIADELYLAAGTVRAHTSKIYQKLGVHTRKEFDELVRPLT